MSDYLTTAATKKNNPVANQLLKLWSAKIWNLTGNREGAFLDFFANNEHHHALLRKIINRYGDSIRQYPAVRNQYDYNTLEFDLLEAIKPYEPPTLDLVTDDKLKCNLCGDRGSVDVLFFWDAQLCRRRPYVALWEQNNILPDTDQVSVNIEPCVCLKGDGINRHKNFKYSQDKRRRIAQHLGYNPRFGKAHDLATRCVIAYRDKHNAPSEPNNQTRTKMSVALKQVLRDPAAGIKSLTGE
jgi:hypothetical protein